MRTDAVLQRPSTILAAAALCMVLCNSARAISNHACQGVRKVLAKISDGETACILFDATLHDMEQAKQTPEVKPEAVKQSLQLCQTLTTSAGLAEAYSAQLR